MNQQLLKSNQQIDNSIKLIAKNETYDNNELYNNLYDTKQNVINILIFNTKVLTQTSKNEKLIMRFIAPQNKYTNIKYKCKEII
ncbi:MAG: hypothetical protein IJ848_03845 [Alphaproteobacteria bacterium]|nr:hypothetical protein [Alphaproteobacteria bacterium]